MIHTEDCQIVWSEDKAELQALCVERDWPAEVIRNGWRHPVETTDHIWYIILWKSSSAESAKSASSSPSSSASSFPPPTPPQETPK